MGSKPKQQRLYKWSYAFRIRRLTKALGWTMKKLSVVSGIKISTLNNIANWRGPAKEQPVLHLDTIRKIVHIEHTYATILKQYDVWPTKYDRTPDANRFMGPSKLLPIEVSRPEDIAKVGVLASNRRSEAKSQIPHESVIRARRERVKRIAQTWAKRVASGWNWHESRQKVSAGRPYYNMGRERRMAAGFQTESTDTTTKKDEET